MGKKKKDQYTKVITIRVTEQQYEWLKEDAEDWGTRIVDIIRWLIDIRYK